MTVLVALGDVPWPPTSGGRLRDAVTVASVDLVARDARLVCFAFRGLDSAAHLREADVIDLALPGGMAARAALRASAVRHRRHPFLEHLIRAGGLRQFEAIVQKVRPTVTILGYPLYVGFADVARAAGSRVLVDLMERRATDGLGRLRTGPGLTARARAALDVWAAASVEKRVSRMADEVWFVTPADAAAYARETGATTRVVPNTVRTEGYARYRSLTPDPALIGFVGSFDNAANRAAAMRLVNRILPLLRDRIPSVGVRLIGRHPPAWFSRMMMRTPGVQMVADAPDALQALGETFALVAPLESGSGTKLKVLEAAAAGIPVISNRVGLAGLTFNPGVDVLLVEDDAAFVDAIVRLRDDNGLRYRLRAAALATVIDEYDVSVANRAIAEALAGFA